MSDPYRDNVITLSFDDASPGVCIGAADPYSVPLLREYVRLRSMDHGMDSVCYAVLQAADAMQEYRERNGLAKGPKPVPNRGIRHGGIAWSKKGTTAPEDPMAGHPSGPFSRE